MSETFHLSLGVRSIEESVNFFTTILEGKVQHRDPSGYVNIALHGCQITLKENPDVDPKIPDFHFGFNTSVEVFESISQRILKSNYKGIVTEPKIVDVGTSMERKKMYLKCPTGYLIEIKGMSVAAAT